MKKRTLLLLPATLSLLMVSSIKPGEEYLNTEDFNVSPLEVEGEDDKLELPFDK